MDETRKIILCALRCGAAADAQQAPPVPWDIQARQWLNQLLAQRMETWRSGESLLAANAAARREAQLRHEEFLGLAQKFLTRWNDLALEKSEGWLAPN